MATKRSAGGAPDEADREAKRLRRVGELLAQYGDDENFMGAVEVVAGGVVHRDRGERDGQHRRQVHARSGR